MAARTHTLNAAGALISISPADHDDEGAPPVIPGVKVTTSGADGEIPDSSGHPDTVRAAAMASQFFTETAEITETAWNHIEKGRPELPRPFKDNDVARALVDKFPTFDPSWPEKTKKAWFDGFSELLIIIKGD